MRNPPLVQINHDAARRGEGLGEVVGGEGNIFRGRLVPMGVDVPESRGRIILVPGHARQDKGQTGGLISMTLPEKPRVDAKPSEEGGPGTNPAGIHYFSDGCFSARGKAPEGAEHA